MQSIVAGLAMSGVAMGFAAFGLLSPIAGALTQELIDVAVIANALRALTSGHAAAVERCPLLQRPRFDRAMRRWRARLIT